MKIIGRLSLMGGILLLCAGLSLAQRTSRRNLPASEPGPPPVPRVVGRTTAEPEPTPPSAPQQPIAQPTPAGRQPRPIRLEEVVVEQDTQGRRMNRLEGRIEVLISKIGFLEAQQRKTYDLQRLMYAEQRAETLRSQLLETQNKEIDVERRTEQVDYNLRPENITNASVLYGSTRPEEIRENQRRALENEKRRLLAQKEILRLNRERLEIAVEKADREVDRLREKLDKDDEELRKQSAAADPDKPKEKKPKPAPETTVEDPPEQ